MLERLAEYFYNPLVFWTVPLLLVALIVIWRRLYRWGLRHFTSTPPGNEPEDSS